MGVNIDDAALRARAAEIKAAKELLGEDYTTNPITDSKTGAIFTYKKGANGELTCSYSYHDEKPSETIFFQRTTVPTSSASLGYLNDKQLEEYLQNHPEHFYATEYIASDEARNTKESAEANLNHYDKKTRKAAEKTYKQTVATEFVASGAYDEKSANKLAKYAMNDAKAGLRAEYREVFMDKDAYNAAKKDLERKQKAAKERIKLYKDAGRAVPPEDEEILKRSVEYIKDKDVRKYVEAHPDRFYTDGKFDNEKYHAWAESQLQGDNTLTTSERKPASIATTLSEKDAVKAVKYAGYDAQKDQVVLINTAKSIAGLIAGPIVAYCTNHNISAAQDLAQRLEIVADENDPTVFKIFLDGELFQEQHQDVLANFRNVATRNAILSSALATVLNNPLVDPAGARDRKAEGITAATISEQNIFRKNEVIDIQGQVEFEAPITPVEEEKYQAQINRTVTDGKESVKFNIEAEPTGKYVLYKGKRLPQWKAHLWGAMYAAYDIPKEEQAAFRAAYRERYLDGAAFYDSSEQETLKEFEYQFNGVTRKVTFDSDKYHNTWDYYVRDKKGKCKSARVKEQGTAGQERYNGNASMSVNDKERASVSTANQPDATSTRQDMQRQVNERVKNGDITPEQGQKLINEIQEAPVTN